MGNLPGYRLTWPSTDRWAPTAASRPRIRRSERRGAGRSTRVIGYPTTALLVGALGTGVVPPIGDDTRAQAIDDLRFWEADVVVLPAGKNSEVLRTTMTQLLGIAPRQVDDVWLRDVRALR